MNNLQEQKRALKQKIESWKARATMAEKGNRSELVISALEKAAEYQTLFNDLEYLESVDPGSDDPTSPSYVPRNPVPNSGAGAITLPLPEKKKTIEDSETK